MVENTLDVKFAEIRKLWKKHYPSREHQRQGERASSAEEEGTGLDEFCARQKFVNGTQGKDREREEHSLGARNALGSSSMERQLTDRGEQNYFWEKVCSPRYDWGREFQKSEETGDAFLYEGTCEKGKRLLKGI